MVHDVGVKTYNVVSNPSYVHFDAYTGKCMYRDKPISPGLDYNISGQWCDPGPIDILKHEDKVCESHDLESSSTGNLLFKNYAKHCDEVCSDYGWYSEEHKIEGYDETITCKCAYDCKLVDSTGDTVYQFWGEAVVVHDSRSKSYESFDITEIEPCLECPFGRSLIKQKGLSECSTNCLEGKYQQ